MTQPAEYPFAGDRTPYASALERHMQRQPTMLMVPGHGATAAGPSRRLAEFAGERAVAMDIPRLIEGIDVGPRSPLARAQELAAEAWSARSTWFLTNGASQANRMAAIAVGSRGRGSAVLMQRSAHSSFTDGVLVADLFPFFMMPSVDTARGIHHGVTAAQVEEHLAEARAAGEDVGAVYIVSPSYFGAVADVAAISRVTRAAGVPLIVDGAWGAHFGFHESFPESPTRLGADIVISSTHKLGGSFTQSAMIHLGEGPFADEFAPLLERAFMLTQSTSESALLLGSLDIARATLEDGEGFAESVAAVAAFRERLRQDGRFPIVSDSFGEFSDIVADDPMRVSIDVTSTGLTGHAVRSLLGERFAVYLEIATVSAVVAFVGPGKLPDLDRLFAALDTLHAEHGGGGLMGLDAIPPLPRPGALRVRPREAYFGTHRTVDAQDAIGRVSVDALSAYPPGIPNVLPGEEITRETVEFLRAVAAAPIGYVRGALDPAVAQLRVLAAE
ncbi:amino acid decarboxylase [Leucobacter chromiireducens]